MTTKLHLGCGRKYLDGYYNIDSDPSVRADLIWDITELDFKQGTVDEILAIHVFEHIHPIKATHTLTHWWRLLKPGGTLILEMPSLTKILRNFQDNPHEKLTRWGLYGDPYQSAKNPAMAHCWAYYPSEIIAMLNILGACIAREEEPHYHKPIRDMRIVAVK